jgi:hypothetical protein
MKQCPALKKEKCDSEPQSQSKHCINTTQNIEIRHLSTPQFTDYELILNFMVWFLFFIRKGRLCRAPVSPTVSTNSTEGFI